MVGFDEQGAPHLRIEHRVVPAGPTVADSIANAAFYFGMVTALATLPEPPELHLPFEHARDNFYAAARYGLDARVYWLDGTYCTLEQLCLDELLPLARQGLVRLGIEQVEVSHWLGIIEGRLRARQTGAIWQRAWVDRYGKDMKGLTAAYLERQSIGRPVHEWSL